MCGVHSGFWANSETNVCEVQILSFFHISMASVY